MNTLNKRISATVTAIAMALGATAFSTQSSAHNGDGLSALSTLSALPVASVLVTGAAVGASGVAASTAVIALPVALAASGAVLVVKSIEVSARGTICVLERASDGASATIEIAGRMVIYATDGEMATALADLERRIAKAASGARRRIVRTAADKGL